MEKDRTFLPPARLLALADALPTPFYLYDAAGIRASVKALRQAFSWNAGFQTFFPVKAAPEPGILCLLHRAGCGVVCSSAAELALCTACGFAPAEILFAPNFPLDADVRAAARLGCQVNLDGPELISFFADRQCLPSTVGLRINPGRFMFGSTTLDLTDLKFGFPLTALADSLKRLRDLGVTAFGLHSYLCGNTLDPAYFPANAALLQNLGAQLSASSGLPLAYLNLSGGLGIPYRPDDRPLDLASVAADVRSAWTLDVPLFTELGRLLTGPHGILLTRVLHCKHSYRDYLGVDASAADLMRPMLYGAYHHISVVGKADASALQPYDVVGAICENADKFAQGRLLPPTVPGDLLVFHDVGAHCHAMGYNYGGRLRCGEYLWENDAPHLIRRADTVADYLSPFRFFQKCAGLLDINGKDE